MVKNQLTIKKGVLELNSRTPFANTKTKLTNSLDTN
jgi:hypothetical protein